MGHARASRIDTASDQVPGLLAFGRHGQPVMRPSRRAALAVGAGLAAAVALRAFSRQRGSHRREAINVRGVPIASFRKGGSPDERRFGDLLFRSGLVLSADADGFGGWSGLWRSPGGAEMVAISDNAQWMTARVNSPGGRLRGLEDVILSPVLGADGEPLRHTRAYDTEALAIAEGTAYVGIERVHEVRRFEWARDGVSARGIPLALPAEARKLPANGSLEAVAVAPRGHPLAGAVLVIAEEASSGADDPTLGWVLTGPQPFGFEVARSAAFDITDAAFLPSGELLLLERRYAPSIGVACRIRRVARDAIRPEARIDGQVIFEANNTAEIDNMEGLAVHRDPESGETVLTLISDDNFSPVQRTLLLEFAVQA